MNKIKKSKEFISTVEAAKVAKGLLSRPTIIRMFDKKQIIGVRPNGKRMIHRQSFLTFLRQKANCLEARALI